MLVKGHFAEYTPSCGLRLVKEMLEPSSRCGAIFFVPHHLLSLKALATITLLRYKQGLQLIPTPHLTKTIMETDEMKDLCKWSQSTIIKRPEFGLLSFYRRTPGVNWRMIPLMPRVESSKEEKQRWGNMTTRTRIMTALTRSLDEKPIEDSLSVIYGMLQLYFSFDPGSMFKTRYIRQTIPLYFDRGEFHYIPHWGLFERDLDDALFKVKTRLCIQSELFYKPILEKRLALIDQEEEERCNKRVRLF